jgi:hypothetical protein
MRDCGSDSALRAFVFGTCMAWDGHLAQDFAWKPLHELWRQHSRATLAFLRDGIQGLKAVDF